VPGKLVEFVYVRRFDGTKRMELKRSTGEPSTPHDHIHDAEKTSPRDSKQGDARGSETAGVRASTESRAIKVAAAVLRPTLP